MKTAIKAFSMSESVRSNKSLTQSSETSSKSHSSTVSSRISGKSDAAASPVGSSSAAATTTATALPHKFSSIVNKVESLISKMNNDKMNNFRLLQQASSRQHAPNIVSSSPCSKCKHACKRERDCSRERLNHTIHSTSLDSLTNLTDAESCEGNELIYTDSDDAEIAHITGTTAVQVHQRRSDLDQLTDQTIREFNEQCFSLSHGDMDVDSVWSTEEDEELKCSENFDSIDNYQQQQQQQNGHETSFNGNNQRDNNNNNCHSGNYNNNHDVNKSNNNNNKHNEHDLNLNLNLNSGSSSNSNSNANVASGDADYREHSGIVANNHNNNTNNNNNSNSCNNDSNMEEINDCNHKHYAKIQTNNNNGGSVSALKVRRASNASSGSVGRMETILEEPNDCKISVKEILQRFETMNMSEVSLRVTCHLSLKPTSCTTIHLKKTSLLK